MSKMRQTLLAASLLLMSAGAFGTALAHDDGHRKGSSGGESSESRHYDYGNRGDHDDDDRRPDNGWRDVEDDNWNDPHWKRKKQNSHDGKYYEKRYNEDFWRKAFNLHAPGYLKGVDRRLPLLIVVDSKGEFRGQPSRVFFQKKAHREGFILAYALVKGDRVYNDGDTDDLIVRTVLNMLDGHYRVNTDRISIRYD